MKILILAAMQIILAALHLHGDGGEGSEYHPWGESSLPGGAAFVPDENYRCAAIREKAFLDYDFATLTMGDQGCCIPSTCCDAEVKRRNPDGPVTIHPMNKGFGDCPICVAEVNENGIDSILVTFSDPRCAVERFMKVVTLAYTTLSDAEGDMLLYFFGGIRSWVDGNGTVFVADEHGHSFMTDQVDELSIGAEILQLSEEARDQFDRTWGKACIMNERKCDLDGDWDVDDDDALYRDICRETRMIAHLAYHFSKDEDRNGAVRVTVAANGRVIGSGDLTMNTSTPEDLDETLLYFQGLDLDADINAHIQRRSGGRARMRRTRTFLMQVTGYSDEHIEVGHLGDLYDQASGRLRRAARRELGRMVDGSGGSSWGCDGHKKNGHGHYNWSDCDHCLDNNASEFAGLGYSYLIPEDKCKAGIVLAPGDALFGQEFFKLIGGVANSFTTIILIFLVVCCFALSLFFTVSAALWWGGMKVAKHDERKPILFLLIALAFVSATSLAIAAIFLGLLFAGVF